jgi:hypothetical protein
VENCGGVSIQFR